MESAPIGTPVYWSEACLALSAADPILADLIGNYPDSTLAGHGDAFLTLARSIVGQQISVKAADSVWQRLQNHLHTITPERVLAETDTALRACGLSHRKIQYLCHLANYAIAGHLAYSRFTQHNDETVIHILSKLHGIGRWSAEMFLIFHLLRPDVLPLRDLALLKAIAKHYATDTRDGKAAIDAISERWRPWRSVATWYLWRSLDPVAVAY